MVALHWNEQNLNPSASNNWRASLVPAAAVIPAPKVYTKAVAVKTLVVEFLHPVQRVKETGRWGELLTQLFRSIMTLILRRRTNPLEILNSRQSSLLSFGDTNPDRQGKGRIKIALFTLNKLE